ncbi:MAG: RDD family protein [Acidimicrobiales bacterium]
MNDDVIDEPLRDPTAVVARRVVALLIDLLVVAVVVLPVYWASSATRLPDPSQLAFTEHPEAAGTCGELTVEIGGKLFDKCAATVLSGNYVVEAPWRSTATVLTFAAAVLAMFVIVQGLSGATVGKAICAIRTVDGAGASPGLGRALLRTVVDIPVFGLVVAALTSRHQRIGDMVAATFVVDRDEAGRPLLTPAEAATVLAPTPPPLWTAPAHQPAPTPQRDAPEPTPTPAPWTSPAPAPAPVSAPAEAPAVSAQAPASPPAGATAAPAERDRIPAAASAEATLEFEPGRAPTSSGAQSASVPLSSGASAASGFPSPRAPIFPSPAAEPLSAEPKSTPTPLLPAAEPAPAPAPADAPAPVPVGARAAAEDAAVAVNVASRTEAAAQPAAKQDASGVWIYEPQWDESRQTYICWDERRNEWLEFFTDRNEWGPISR